jgi:hypothetical protein
VAEYARLWTEVLSDPKLMRAARKGAKCLALLPWIIVFAKRAKANGRLEVDGAPADEHDIAPCIPGVTAAKVKCTLSDLEQIGVLVRDADGALRFSAWEFRNAGKASDSREAVAERVRNHRSRKKAGGNGGNALQVVTAEVLPVVTGNDTESREKRAETRNEKPGRKTLSAKKPPTTSWLAPVAEVWERHKGAGSFRWPKAGSLLKALHQQGRTGEEIAANLGRYLSRVEPQFASLARFAETFADHNALKGPQVVDGWLSAEAEALTRPKLVDA